MSLPADDIVRRNAESHAQKLLRMRELRKHSTLMPPEPDVPLLGLSTAEFNLYRLHKKAAESGLFSPLRLKYLLHAHSDLATAFFLHCGAFALCHPLTTLKTRAQAADVRDTCGVVRRGASASSLGRGFLSTMALALLSMGAIQAVGGGLPRTGDTFRDELAVLLAADAMTAPFRLFFEIRRCLLQINAPRAEVLSRIRRVFPAFALRDVGFRICYYFGAVGAVRLGAADMTALFTGALFGTLLTAPLDTGFTRLVGQQVERYKGARAVVATMFREEGLGRLLAGSGYRLVGFLLPILVNKSLFLPLKSEIESAYSVENLLG